MRTCRSLGILEHLQLARRQGGIFHAQVDRNDPDYAWPDRWCGAGRSPSRGDPRPLRARVPSEPAGLLPLPPGDSALTGGDIPVVDETDVLAEFPEPIKRAPTAPVRDAFAAAWAEGFKEYQRIASRAAGQSDPMQATGDYLRSFAEEHSVVPLSDESEASIRARLFAAPPIVTPNVIVDGVNAILAPFTTGTCHLSELELDGWFVHDDDASVWDSFIGTDPNYPDRYYDDLPSLQSGGATPSWGFPRSFVLRIPSVSTNDDAYAYMLTDDNDGLFAINPASDADGDNAFAVYEKPALAEDVYLDIVRFVTVTKGQGVTFAVIVDDSLN